MATLLEQYRVGESTRLRERVLAAVIRTAAAVRVAGPARPEGGGNMTPARIAKRQQLALTAMVQPEALVAPFARQCADNGTIQGAVTYDGAGAPNVDAVPDGDIIYVVGVSWDLVAGVSLAEMAAA